MHALCMQQRKATKARSRSEATPRRRQTRPTKKNQRRNPKTRKESRRGWVRIRDLKHPRIHNLDLFRHEHEKKSPAAKSAWKISTPEKKQTRENSFCQKNGKKGCCEFPSHVVSSILRASASFCALLHPMALKTTTSGSFSRD